LPQSKDVHDIGKNLVDIILSNKVVNLGIKPVDNIIEAYEQHKADCIAMSGLWSNPPLL